MLILFSFQSSLFHFVLRVIPEHNLNFDQGRSWVLESRGSNCGVVDESLPQAKFFFLVARCFWCVLVHCEEEINLVIFHLTFLKHVYFRPTCIGLS